MIKELIYMDIPFWLVAIGMYAIGFFSYFWGLNRGKLQAFRIENKLKELFDDSDEEEGPKIINQSK